MNESMCCSDTELQVRQQLRAWFSSPLGLSLQALETNHLRQVLPKFYGAVALQLGWTGNMDLLNASPIPTQIMVDLQSNGRIPTVYGVPESLPFESKSADIILLPHTLDFSREPHQVLREAHRVLSPEGSLVILGFNPLSIWGLRRLIARRNDMPWCGQFIHLLRLKDWLALLDFEMSHGNMLYYRPPVQREALRDYLYFMERIGDRWWPLTAAVYLLVAKKRVLGLTPLRPSWRRRALRVCAAQAVTKNTLHG